MWIKRSRLVIRYICFPLLFAVAGCLLLMAVSLIPQSRIEENARISANQFINNYNITMLGESEDQRYYWDKTDILIIEESYNLKNFSSALLNPYYNSYKLNFSETFAVMLQDGLEGNIPYVRYWQGFRVFVRPLMIFFSFQDMRKLCALVFFVLFSCLTAAVAKKQGFGNAFAVAAAVSLFNPAVVSHSLQYAPCFLLMFAFSIYVVVKDIDAEHLGILFAFFGMLTQYIDFYTVPFITCLIPALLVMSKNPPDKGLWKTLAVCSLSWLYGYIAIWLVKLLLVTAFTPVNGFSDGFDSLAYRLAGNEQSKRASIILALKWAWWLSSPGRYSSETFFVLAVAVIISCAAACIREQNLWSAVSRRVPYLIAAALPVLWVAVGSDPMIIHAYFQYRTMLPFYVGIFLFICQCFQNN